MITYGIRFLEVKDAVPSELSLTEAYLSIRTDPTRRPSFIDQAGERVTQRRVTYIAKVSV